MIRAAAIPTADLQLELHWLPDPGFLIQGFLIQGPRRIIEDAYGEPPPRPALLDMPIVAKRCGLSSAKVLHHVLSPPLWKPFGEM